MLYPPPVQTPIASTTIHTPTYSTLSSRPSVSSVVPRYLTLSPPTRRTYRVDKHCSSGASFCDVSNYIVSKSEKEPKSTPVKNMETSTPFKCSETVGVEYWTQWLENFKGKHRVWKSVFL